MDFLTHALIGAAISRTGLERRSSLSTATLITAALIPDVDIIYMLRGSVSGITHHRGFTHTLVGVPIMSALTIFIVWLFWLRSRTRRRCAPPKWPLLYSFA